MKIVCAEGTLPYSGLTTSGPDIQGRKGVMTMNMRTSAARYWVLRAETTIRSSPGCGSRWEQAEDIIC